MACGSALSTCSVAVKRTPAGLEGSAEVERPAWRCWSGGSSMAPGAGLLGSDSTARSMAGGGCVAAGAASRSSGGACIQSQGRLRGSNTLLELNLGMPTSKLEYSRNSCAGA